MRCRSSPRTSRRWKSRATWDRCRAWARPTNRTSTTRAHRGPTLHAPLAGEQVFDVCVLGGGISGLSAALHLAERGMRVALLEARHLGYGGSGRSGGQSIFGYACEMSTLEKAVGMGDARRMWDVAVEGMQLQRELIARHSIDCDYTAGHMILGLKRRHDEALREELESLATRYDYHSLRLIGRDELRTLIASQRYSSALYDSNGGHLHPYRYTLGLGRAAAGAGVRIFENSWVTRLDIAQNASADNLAHTVQGTLRARHLLVAGGALLGRLIPKLASKLMDIGTYIAATQPLGEERARSLITNDAARGRHELDPRLFPPLDGSPAAVRRTRELLGHRSIRFGARAAQPHRESVSAARRSAHRICLGRFSRHHAESRTALRPPGPECLVRAGPLGSWHGDLGHRGQARQRSHRRHGGAFRHVREDSASRFSRRRASCAGRRWYWPCCGSGSWTCCEQHEFSPFRLLPVVVGAAGAAGCVTCSPGCCRCPCATWPSSTRSGASCCSPRAWSMRSPAIRARRVCRWCSGCWRSGRRRLAVFITARNAGKGEDRRYQAIRARNQPHFAFKSLYLVFGLQALLAWVISLPLHGRLRQHPAGGPAGLLWCFAVAGRLRLRSRWRLAAGAFPARSGQCTGGHEPRILALHAPP